MYTCEKCGGIRDNKEDMVVIVSAICTVCAAEDRGVSALQSVETPSQQLKPKMPSYVESMNLALGADWALSDRCLLYEKQCKSLYEYIARHFGR